MRALVLGLFILLCLLNISCSQSSSDDKDPIYTTVTELSDNEKEALAKIKDVPLIRLP